MGKNRMNFLANPIYSKFSAHVTGKYLYPKESERKIPSVISCAECRFEGYQAFECCKACFRLDLYPVLRY